MKTALLIIDVQNDYFHEGRMELYNSVNACNKIKDLLRHFRDHSMPVIYIQHVSIKPGATFFLPETHGVEIHDNIKPVPGEKVIIKNYPNSFRNTELNDYLKKNNISKLVIVGMMTHMCIDTSVRAAFDLGYECIVVGDCCATRNLTIGDNEISAENVQNSFLAALNGTFSKVIRKEDAVKIL
jgi:nicotinamidase-related amidase